MCFRARHTVFLKGFREFYDFEVLFFRPPSSFKCHHHCLGFPLFFVYSNFAVDAHCAFSVSLCNLSGFSCHHQQLYTLVHCYWLLYPAFCTMFFFALILALFIANMLWYDLDYFISFLLHTLNCHVTY